MYPLAMSGLRVNIVVACKLSHTGTETFDKMYHVCHRSIYLERSSAGAPERVSNALLRRKYLIPTPFAYGVFRFTGVVQGL